MKKYLFQMTAAHNTKLQQTIMLLYFKSKADTGRY